jgi:nitrate/nitrite transporter NarK
MQRLHLLLPLLLLLLQDLPEGNFRELMASKAKVKDRSPNTLKAALFNYRSWIMCLNYGYCFGVELVVDNVIVYYLVRRRSTTALNFTDFNIATAALGCSY